MQIMPVMATRWMPPSQAAAPPLSVAGSWTPPVLTARPPGIQDVLQRILTHPANPQDLELVARTLQPYGADVIQRLADNGLRLELGRKGFPHYSADTRVLVLDRDTMARETDPPLRSYAILHEFAHAMDYLWEPSRGPLSARADLGIDAHRRRMGSAYASLLGDYNRKKAQLEREGKWHPPSLPGPLTRVYYEDFITGVERVVGRSMTERSARGHLETLNPDKNPSEYFADSVYCYLHSDPVKTYRYDLPDGQRMEHHYPPDRGLLSRRDPKMHACLEHFFRSKTWKPL